MRVCALLLPLCLVSLGTASAQSLADVARQEGQRRQTVKDGGKTYTNQDLKPVAAAPSEPADVTADGSAPPAAAPAGAADEKAAENAQAEPGSAAKAEDSSDSDVKDQAYWSKRMTDLREQLARDQTFLEALQSRINALTADFVNRDDPIQRTQIANDRDRALAELDRMQKAVEADKRAIPELEEEARRAGVPAGWLR